MRTPIRFVQAVQSFAVAALCGAQAYAIEPPPAIAVPAGHELSVKFAASGVQIYKCLPSAPAATDFVWTFVAPEAALMDAAGQAAGHHDAGPTWQARDGSTIVGKVLAKAPAPDGHSIPWLLLSASVTKPGATFARVAYVQRLQTAGGAAPVSGCSGAAVNAEARVPYTADYYFYTPR